MWKLLTILQAASRLFLNEIENNDGGGLWRKGAKKQWLLGNHFSKFFLFQLLYKLMRLKWLLFHYFPKIYTEMFFMPEDVFTGMWRRYFRHTEGVFFEALAFTEAFYSLKSILLHNSPPCTVCFKTDTNIFIWICTLLCGMCLYECISLNSNIWPSLIYKCILNLWTVSHISFINAFDPLSGYACVCRITQCSSHTPC